MAYPGSPALTPPFFALGRTDAKNRALFEDAKGTMFALQRERFGLPSAITLCGYAASLAWLAGAPWWIGALGIVADELDGRIARATGEVTRFGGELDYAVDVTLTGLCAVRALGPMGLAVLPIVTMTQAALRTQGERPTLGSARAGFSVLGMLR
jgi:phosphatidylglycerophosphate synthase